MFVSLRSCSRSVRIKRRAELHPCHYSQFLQVEQQVESRKVLVDGFLVSRVGIVENSDQTCFFNTVTELIEKTGTQRRQGQAHGVSRVKLQSAEICCKTCGRTAGGRRQSKKYAIFVFRVQSKGRRKNTRAEAITEKNSRKSDIMPMAERRLDVVSRILAFIFARRRRLLRL